MPTQHLKTIMKTDIVITMGELEKALLSKLPVGSTLDALANSIVNFYEKDKSRTLGDFIESIGFDRSHPKFHSLQVVVSAIRKCMLDSSAINDEMKAISNEMKSAILRESDRRGQLAQSTGTNNPMLRRGSNSQETPTSLSLTSAEHSLASSDHHPGRQSAQKVSNAINSGGGASSSTLSGTPSAGNTPMKWSKPEHLVEVTESEAYLLEVVFGRDLSTLTDTDAFFYFETIVARDIDEFFTANRKGSAGDFLGAKGFDNFRSRFKRMEQVVRAIRRVIQNPERRNSEGLDLEISANTKNAIARFVSHEERKSSSLVGKTCIRADVQSRLAQLGIGSRIAVFWPMEKTFFCGTIIDRNERSPLAYTILYDDGEGESIDLSKHEFKILSDNVPEAARAAISASAKGNSSNTCTASARLSIGLAQGGDQTVSSGPSNTTSSAGRSGTVCATATSLTRISPKLYGSGWYQKKLPELGLVFIRPDPMRDSRTDLSEKEIASLVPGVDYFGSEQDVASILSNTKHPDVPEDWTNSWHRLHAIGWRHKYVQGPGLVYVRPSPSPSFVPFYDYFILPTDVLANEKKIALDAGVDRPPCSDNVKSYAKRRSGPGIDDIASKKHCAFTSDKPMPSALPTGSAIPSDANQLQTMGSGLDEQVASKSGHPMDQKNNTEDLKNEIRYLRGCLKSIHGLLPADQYVPNELKLSINMIRDKIPRDVSE
mmetsp:Transcript_25460/g.73636  ORF Transcript_25460/g.73636 Transcript_25460/m.73636 type:complete len:714 (-) Transcript_25460:91-2232(-)